MTQSKEEKILATVEKQLSIEREIKEHKKIIKQIKSSKTWRTSKPYRHVKKLLTNNEEVKKNELITVIEDLETALYQAEEQIDRLQLKDTEKTTAAIQQKMRDMKDAGKLIASLDAFIQDKVLHQDNYREALVFAARLYMKAKTADQQLVYKKVLTGLNIKEIPEFMIRAGLIENAISLQSVSSFRASLNMRIRQKQLQDKLPEWPLDNKLIAYNFVRNLHVATPKVDENYFTLDHIPIQEAIVLKPADGAGARGVYLVHTTTDIYDVKKSESLSSWDELIERMQLDLQTGAVAEDVWLIEQLIYEDKAIQAPARDIKFYSFYGKVGLILEIKREPEIRQCWWTPTGKRIDTGKYEESLFHGLGVTSEEIALVEKLSSEIPAPFLRIDYLRGEDGLVFGEFTPKPGNYEEFNQQTDQLLGDYFLDAEARLVNDLLQGKQFKAYGQYVQNMANKEK